MNKPSLKLKGSAQFDGQYRANMVGVFRIGSIQDIFCVLEVDQENNRLKLSGNPGTAWYPIEHLKLVTYLGTSDGAKEIKVENLD